MKKFLCYSTIAMTLFVLFTVLTFSAFAQSTGKYWEPVSDVQDTQGFVNGEISEKISSRAGDEKGTIIYSYDGEGKLTDWEFPLLNAGKDFEADSVGFGHGDSGREQL